MTADHREYLYMGIGWSLMDLRQDMEFAHLFTKDGPDYAEVIERLKGLQNEVGAYADQHFPEHTNSDGF